MQSRLTNCRANARKVPCGSPDLHGTFFLDNMIIAFDGNVYTGKSSLVRSAALECGASVVGEHSQFLGAVVENNHVQSVASAVSLQLSYFEAEASRIGILRTHGISLIDRSFVSFAAHIFALYECHEIDVREWFLSELAKRIEAKQVIIPDVYCFVHCGIDTISKRLAGDRSRGTDTVYLQKDYLSAVNRFNQLWCKEANGIDIDTDRENAVELAKVLCKDIASRSFSPLSPQQVCTVVSDLFKKTQKRKV